MTATDIARPLPLRFLRGARRRASTAVWSFLLTPYQRIVATPINKARNAGKTVRQLEIGPGPNRIPAFETLNVVGGPAVDYVADASKGMPFPSETFDLVYASHIIEHIPWYRTETSLKDWVRVLKSGGRLEIWTPDTLKIARAFVDAEERGDQAYHNDDWWKFNVQKDPCVWMAGRCYSYGDGTGKPSDPNWHRALFSERRLRDLLANAGLQDIRTLSRDEVRGYDHGWINLGICGTKP